MKKIRILKLSIIAVIILILATIIYAVCSKVNKKENKSEEILHAIDYSNNEQIEEDEIINVEISNETSQVEHTKLFKVGVQQIQQIMIKEAEKKAEKEKENDKENDKDKKEEQNFKKIEGSTPYYIRVNYQANTVTVYTKDEKGKYTVPYKAMICSCGTWTPHSGTYALSYRSKWRALFGGVNGKYATDITGDILFHSVPYLSQSSDSLEYWEFDKLGTTASLGCVRLQVKDAKWIYDNCGWGTLVEFYASSDPGPLGKPSAPKITSNKECRDWDPTDPEKGNPWHTYEEEKEKKEEQDKDKDKNISSNKNNVTDENNKGDKNNTVDKNNTTNTTNKETNETNKSEVSKEETINKDNNTNKQEPTEDKKEENVETGKTENETPKQEENIPEQEQQPEQSEPEDESTEDIPEQTEPEEDKTEETNPNENENKGEDKLDDVA